jgi:hypothetical protein
MDPPSDGPSACRDLVLRPAFRTGLRPTANRSPSKNNASGDGKGILAPETGGGFGHTGSLWRPRVRENCMRYPLSRGNHEILSADRKNSRTERVVGGARRNRTDDLFNAIEALSQLSYGPKLSCYHAPHWEEAASVLRGGCITAKARAPQGLIERFFVGRGFAAFFARAPSGASGFTAPRPGRCRRRSAR